MGALWGWTSETVAVAPNYYSTFITCPSPSACFSQVSDGAVAAKHAREKGLRLWATWLVFDCPRGCNPPRLGQGAEELQRVSRTEDLGHLAKASQRAEVARCEQGQMLQVTK